MSEKEGVGIRERDNCCQKIIFMFLGFTFATSAHSISEEVVGFSPLWFPQGKFFVSLFSCSFIAVHVMLSFKDPKIIMLG